MAAMVAPKPTFELHGVTLNGSFNVFFESDKWYKKDFLFIETRISQDDLKKLTEAARSKIEVTLRFGNGEGKAQIRGFHFDPNRQVLTKISFDLLDWSWI